MAFVYHKHAVGAILYELLSIWGIGTETADVILVYAFYQPTFIIDAYTCRFLLRLGYEFADDTAIKTFLKQGCPKKLSFTGGIIGYSWSIEESVNI